MHSPQEQFKVLNEKLSARHPEATIEATQLANSTVDPGTADADAIWRVVWDKPLYANTRVSVAEQWIKSIETDMVGAWQIWGADPKVFDIRQVRGGIKRENFEIQGELAHEIVKRHRIALHRLSRIQGAAAALRARARNSKHPFSDSSDKPLSELVPTLQGEFGRGWGPITVLHVLTDMGLAVKPDIHLVRSVRFLRLTLGLADGRLPNLQETIRINADVRSFLKSLGRPDTPAELRYLDKILMELSRCNVLE